MKIHIDDLIKRIADYEKDKINGLISYTDNTDFNIEGCECCRSKATETATCTDMKNITHNLCNNCLSIIINADTTCLQYSADSDGYLYR